MSRVGRACLVLLSALALTACGAGASTEAASGRTFVEKFRWLGPHAFVTDSGGSAVWWNQNNWDVRADTYDVATRPNDEAGQWRGHYAAILKAASPGNRHSSAVNEGAKRVGGDGSAGVGVMRLDFQGIMSARLRNPMLVSSRRPGVIKFDAPLFASTGHWWEVALTPSAQPTPGEYTAVPSRQSPEGLNNPITGQDDDGSTNGPGHRASVRDAINVISTGFPDAPACDNSGWHSRWAVTEARDGRVTDHVNPKRSIEKLKTVNPKKRTELHSWRIEVRPSGIRLYGDLNNDGRMERVDRWRVRVPWRSAYVHLIYVAYQSGHHPQADCGLHQFGIEQAQTTGWRNVKVSPVAYGHTYALPEPKRSVNVARDTGWMSYDLRDINMHTERAGGLAPPNLGPYDKYTSYLVCSKDNGGGIPCPNRARDSVTLKTSIKPKMLRRLRRAQLVADVRYPGSAKVTVNGRDAGTLGGQRQLPDVNGNNGFTDAFEVEAWNRKSIDLPAGALRAGANTIRLELTPDVDIELDRIQLELSTG